MSFMIEEDDVEEAVRSLHAHFFVDPDPDIFDVAARSETAVPRGRHASAEQVAQQSIP
jgi:aspartate kinase